MTRKNEELRGLIKAVELAAVQCLNSQPHDDIKCEHHLRKCLAKIADMVGDFRGLVEVEAYDIDWGAPGKDMGLPESTKVMVGLASNMELLRRLSNIFGRSAAAFKWRLT